MAARARLAFRSWRTIATDKKEKQEQIPGCR